MTVRAKMVLDSVTRTRWSGEGQTLKFVAEYDDTIPEDQRFQEATPTASAEFYVTNKAALEQFHIGEAYYVDFTPVPKEI